MNRGWFRHYFCFLKGDFVNFHNITLKFVTLFVGFLVLFSPLETQARVLEKIYAVVNGETITLSEIKEYQVKLKSGGFLNDLLFSDPAEREKALKDRDYLIKRLVDEKILDFAVKQHGLLVTEERVDKEIKTIAERQNLSIARLQQALKDQNVERV